MVEQQVKKETIVEDSSSEDSAYQVALEMGSDYYSKNKSDRARHRNFRKCKYNFYNVVVSKGEEYLLYKAQFVHKINELNLQKGQDLKNQTKELWHMSSVSPSAAIFKATQRTHNAS